MVHVPLSCPCGHVINRAAELDDSDHQRWATIRDRNYMKVIAGEITCHEISPDDLPEDGHPRADEYHAAFRETADLIGSILECPECGRLHWMKPGDDRYRVLIRRAETGGDDAGAVARHPDTTPLTSSS